MNRLLLYRRYWIVPILLWTALAGGSYLWNSAALNRYVQEQILNRGRFVFQIVEASRLWNAMHGGVYGLMDQRTPPNPYLEVPERDLVTPLGKSLTLLNPAYMTRQLAGIVRGQMDVKIHLTSLKPLNPDNWPDEWEARALKGFERGEKEFLEILEGAPAPEARYMAPLLVKPPCLECHLQQGYREGDVRGGIGVSFPLANFLPGVTRQRHNMAAVHLTMWLLVSLLTLAYLHMQRRRVLSLQLAKAEQEEIVAERTAELRSEVLERQSAESRMRLLLDSSGEGIIGLDTEGRCTLCNPMALQLLGHRRSAGMVGHPFLDLVQPQDSLGGVEGPHWHRIDAWRGGHPVHEEDAAFRRADGSTLAVEFRIHPMIAEGELLGAVVNFSDITGRKQAQERIWHQANYDPLTGLPNRQLLFDRLEQAIAQAQRLKEQVSVLFIDLDGFKPVNDGFGHELGDRLLKMVSGRLADGLRLTDTLARLGGDEFVLILSAHPDRHGAETVAQKIVTGLSEPFVLDGQEVRIGASVGIAHFPEHGQTAADLVRNADRAMYEVKESGRNAYRVYRPRPNSIPPTEEGSGPPS